MGRSPMGSVTRPLPALRGALSGVCLAIGALFGAGLTGPTLAQEMSTVHSGGRVEINAHGVCRRVHNGTSNGVMIPIKSPQEWSVGTNAFLQNVPTGMTAYACVSPEVALRRWSRPGPPGTDRSALHDRRVRSRPHLHLGWDLLGWGHALPRREPDPLHAESDPLEA